MTGGTTKGGTIITLYGKGFHEFEGKRTPQFARCRFTDGRDVDDTIAIFLSGAELRCATPSKPDTATHELFVSLNGADFDPTPFSFGFYSMEPQRSRRVSFRVIKSVGEVAVGSRARETFASRLASDLASALRETDGRNVTAARVQVVRIVADGTDAINVVVEILPASSAQLPTPLLLAVLLVDLAEEAASLLYATGRLASSLIDPAIVPVVRTGFVVAPVFHSLSVQGGPLQGGTIVDLQGAALDAFNSDRPDLVRCRWGEESSGLVTPTYFSSSLIRCRTTPVASVGTVRLYVSLNGIAPFEDTGLDFYFYQDLTQNAIESLSPSGGPNDGGTLVTVYARGLDALGTYKPPATGAARCRWGEWSEQDAMGTVYRETTALLITTDLLVCPTPPRGTAEVDVISIGINGQQFVRTQLQLIYYQQPGAMVLLSGRLRGPSSGGTRWVMREAEDWRGTLTGFAHTTAKLRYCRWGLQDTTVAEVVDESSSYNASTTIVCSSAPKGLDFAGDVSVSISLNGRDWSPTQLTFRYFRQPRITAYSPHGGPVMCTESAVEGTSGDSVGEVWDTAR